MSTIQKLLSYLGIKKKAAPMGSGQFMFVNGQLSWIEDNLESYVKNGYQTNDIIYSAVNLVMDKVRCAPWGLYKVVDESSLKAANGILANKPDSVDYMRAMHMKRKALELIKNPSMRLGKLSDLLKYPNEEGTFNDLVADGVGFELITGNCEWYGDILDGGSNKGIPNEIWNMPAQYMTPIVTRGFPMRIVGWQMSAGTLTRYEKESVLHTKFWNPTFDINGGGILGQSPWKAANRTITRNNASKKAGATQLENNGAAGIAYVDDSRLTPDQAGSQAAAVKRTWAKEYAGPENFGKVAFSGYKMGYTQVGTALKDMDLGKIELTDLRSIANIIGIPTQLLNDPENKSFNNQKEAEKALTSRCAMPRLVKRRDALNRKLQSDWGYKGQNVYVDFGLEVFTELQEDLGEKWTKYVKDLPISSRDKLDMMNIEAPDDPNLDVILVSSNMVPLNDVVLGMSEREPEDEQDPDKKLKY